MIKALREVLQQKDREVLSLQLTIQEIEKRGQSGPTERIGEELNQLKDQNAKMKALLVEYE